MPQTAIVISSGKEWQTSQHVRPEGPHRLSRDGRYRLGASHRRHLLLLRSCDLWLCISKGQACGLQGNEGGEGFGDAQVGGVGLPVDALGVDLERDGDAVPGANVA
jgi:hypothetical protein